MASTPAMERLVAALARLPGIGEKTASRLAFFLLRADADYGSELAEAIVAVKRETRQCSECCSLTESDPCRICVDPRRCGDVLCVVEDHADLLAIERVGDFGGHYHVLHGALAPLDGIGPDQLTIGRLVSRLDGGRVREVIVATNPTADGEATALYIAKTLKPLGVRVTRIAHGLPVGGDLEYADAVTVGRALEGRREM
jgi:recombination protein RecR